MTTQSTAVAAPTPKPKRIGLFEAIGNIITCVGTTANDATEIISANMQSLKVVSNVGTNYALQFEAEANIQLAKKKLALAQLTEINEV